MFKCVWNQQIFHFSGMIENVIYANALQSA